MTEKTHVLAIDQGTTSSRAILFDHDGRIAAVDQKEHAQILPRAGWVEHDAMEIWRNVRSVVAGVLSKAEINRHEIASVGITNQRESVVVWDRATGEPVHNVIVWQDTRTRRICDRLAAAAPDAASTPGSSAPFRAGHRTAPDAASTPGAASAPGSADYDRYRDRVGLGLTTYFAGPKVAACWSPRIPATGVSMSSPFLRP